MRTFFGIAFFLALCPLAFCGESPRIEAYKDLPVVRMNNIKVEKKTKTIRIGVTTVLKRGILEYLLVGDHGKTHETAFSIQGNLPSELNMALLLVGYEPLAFETFNALLQKEGGRSELMAKYKNSLLSMEIYKKGKKVPFNRLVKDREGSKDPLTWVFTGGYFAKQSGRFVPDATLSYIAIWPDRNAIISLFSTHKNPYRGEFGYEINKDNKSMKPGQDYEIVIKKQP